MGKVITFAFFFALVGACAGSPSRSIGMSPERYAEVNLRNKSIEQLCGGPGAFRMNICDTAKERQQWGNYCSMAKQAKAIELNRRGLPGNYCKDPESAKRAIEKVAKQRAFEEAWATDTYNIDRLKVTTFSKRDPIGCSRGSEHRIVVEGEISPDSSFAMSRLLDRLQACENDQGKIINPVEVSLRSNGGLLKDGYLMGRTFRDREVTTIIEENKTCASSCAVAFLGGTKRLVASSGVVMYHAPYFSGENVYGKRDINCEVGETALGKLRSYYDEMTDMDTGGRLFERTMWYCSAENGWVVKGGAASELYGIATEK